MCNIKHPIKSGIPDHHFEFSINYTNDDLILDLFIAHNDIDVIDRDIFAYYTSIGENTCAATLKCGCKCPSVCKQNGYCVEHFYTQDFALATKHAYFKDTTQTFLMKPVVDTAAVDSFIHGLFNMLPPEILMKIVRLLYFTDLKTLYMMRIPAIMDLVQGDMLFNHSAVFNNPAFTTYTIRKFESEYTRGLRAIDTAIHMTSMSSREGWVHTDEDGVQNERDRVCDTRHFALQFKTYRKYYGSSCEDTKRDLKFETSGRWSDPHKTHMIGFRRTFPGIYDNITVMNYIREYVYDDFLAIDPSEKARIIAKFNANRQLYAGANCFKSSWL